MYIQHPTIMQTQSLLRALPRPHLGLRCGPSFPTQPWGCPHLFKTISMGTPGLTMATFIDSLPRSTDITASVSEGETDLSISLSFPAFLRPC